MNPKFRFVKTIFCVSSFLLTSSFASAFEIKDYEKKIKNGYAIRNVVDKLSRKKLEDNLRNFLMTGRPSRIPGTPGHTKAQVFIEEKLKEFTKDGSSVYSREEFAVGEAAQNIKGTNFIWEKKGSTFPLEVIILGAHFDTSVSAEQKNKKMELPGADNNASGTVALLSMIEILSRLDLPKTVRVVFFDAEGAEQLGSKHYLEKFIPAIGNQRILGFIEVKMIGHDSKREDKTGKLGNMKFYTRTKNDKGIELDEALAVLMQERGKKHYPLIDMGIEALPATKVIDSAPAFWQLGIPGIIVSGDRQNDFNPRYQTSNDFFETLNLMTYNNVFRFLTTAVLAWNYDIVK